mmetsp:Transcript_23951/g.33754  ORF Transcript_23951/g.33754 Transcript_23951/m.33754 type:complete len:233 (+) Transcript_23951:24-722(+)|eukprot:CAMPEP_0175095548 /NCGR_PEP_ID=MMETSP0086_2-20121207/4217_1 /TAXON_ID=136419 /ORGANISM="Unknown Unknown, Strain D1" /LENGTH=232 /DNA_ID=CAMNT_0016368809 /DNA_START=24 /DNA_END=722 /DNA_ORIENTATION=+
MALASRDSLKDTNELPMALPAAVQMAPVAQVTEPVQMASVVQGAPVLQGAPVAQQQPQTIIINNTQNSYPANEVLFRTRASPRYLVFLQLKACCLFDCIGCCRAQDLAQRKYIEVMQNRVEWNDPVSLCCCCTLDNVNVVYFDHGVHASKAGCCNPCCEPCPTCCDLFGEGVILSESCCSTKKSVIGCNPCCQKDIMICGYENANGIAATINHASRTAHAQGTPGPAAMYMA